MLTDARMPPSWSGLFTLCLLLLHRPSWSWPLTVADLPATQQTTGRLLAAITISDNTSHYFISKQLQNYAEACEIRFEIHVVLITFPGVWDRAHELLFPTPSKYFCLRLHMLLPVVVASYPRNYLLAHQHRHVFSQFANKYDLFLSQEHDMDVRPRHLLYWTRWRRFFQQHPSVPETDRPLIPGFIRHEVSTALRANNSWNHPAPLLHFAPPLSVLHVGNVTCIAPHKSYPGFYLVDREMLLLAMSKRAWKSDLNKNFPEFNVHHQSTWQWYYFYQVIPVRAIHVAMSHHGSDKYTAGAIKASAAYNASQVRPTEGTDFMELMYTMNSCLGQDWDADKLPYLYPSLQGNNTEVRFTWCKGWLPREYQPVNLTGVKHARCVRPHQGASSAGVTAPCAQCAADGKGTALIYRYTGPALAAQPLRPTGLFMVDASCLEGLAVQELNLCLDEGCSDYYTDVNNDTHLGV